MSLPRKRGFDMEKLDQLINSGVTLSKKEREYVEEYIFAISTYSYPRGYTGTRFK